MASGMGICLCIAHVDLGFTINLQSPIPTTQNLSFKLTCNDEEDNLSLKPEIPQKPQTPIGHVFVVVGVRVMV